jgi:VWFA-related protein
VVEVDLRVTDKTGRPVTGLTAEDFVLFDDGQVVPIEYFTALEPGRVGAGNASGGPESRSEQVEGYAPAGRPDLPLFAIYLDHLSLRPADRDRVLDDVTRFVESLDPRRPIALFTFDGGTSVAVRPTKRVEEVVEGLDRVRREMTKGYQHELDEDRAMQDIRAVYELLLSNRNCPPAGDQLDCKCDEQWRDLLAVWRVYAEEQAALVRSQAAGLIETVSALGAIEEPKDLLYVSSGLTRMPGLAVNEYLAELCEELYTEIVREMGWYDLSTVLHQVTSHANRSRVTIHSLDAGGMRPLAGATVRSEDAKFRLSGRASELRNANLQSGLFTIAEDTGGRAILNANQPFDALQEVRADVEHGYILGFSPDRPPDVRTHRIRVSLAERRKDVELRYRQTYLDPNEEDALIERLLAALQLGWGGNPLGVAVAVGESKRLSGGVAEAPLRIAIPAAAVAESGAGADEETEVQVAGVALDSRGRRTVVRRKRLPIEAPIDGLHFFEIRMKLPPDRYRIGVSLELDGAGRASYVVVDADLTGDGDDSSAPGGEGSDLAPRSYHEKAPTRREPSHSRGPRRAAAAGQPQPVRAPGTESGDPR